MSYYHFFTLKSDSKYKDYTLETVNERLSRMSIKTDYKLLLKAVMIQAYYEEDVNKKLQMISSAVNTIKFDATYCSEYYYLQEILTDEDHAIVRNRPMDEYYMQQCINDFDENINRRIENLLILSTVKFEADEKYSDTPKTTMEYLKYEYQNLIKDELETLDDIIYNYNFAKFCLEECDRETEDERYNKLHPNEDLQTNSSGVSSN